MYQFWCFYQKVNDWFGMSGYAAALWSELTTMRTPKYATRHLKVVFIQQLGNYFNDHKHALGSHSCACVFITHKAGIILMTTSTHWEAIAAHAFSLHTRRVFSQVYFAAAIQVRLVYHAQDQTAAPDNESHSNALCSLSAENHATAG